MHLDLLNLNKSCEELRGTFLPPTRTHFSYKQCAGCEHVFAPEICGWSDERFVTEIYNDDYIHVDPDYLEARPASNAKMLEQLFGSRKDQIRHLDYGGGNGALSKRLSKSGWDSHSFDPFPKGQAEVGDLGKFNLITAFEVFEHVPDPRELTRNLSGLMEDDAVILFSTLLTDGHLEAGKKWSWWYASPRNGHISLFSKKSLQTLAASHANDLHLVSFNAGFHCLFRTIPNWARHVLSQT